VRFDLAGGYGLSAVAADGLLADLAAAVGVPEDDGRVAWRGPVDISFNAISLPQTGIQGTRITDLPADRFDLPMATYPKANFLTARAAHGA
jgi:hypothetical protein